MTVPIHADFFAGRSHHLIDSELHEVERPTWRGVADRVAENDGARTVSNGRRIQPLDGIGIGAHRVFRDVHGRKTVLDREPYRLFGGPLEVLDRPVFHQAPDRTGAKKRCRFNGHAHHLRDLYDGTDVVFVSARRAVGFDLHPLRGDFAS